jgi:hypothetical protein
MIDMSDERVSVAQFGKQVEMFLETDIGRYLVSRAKEDIDQAVEEMKRTNPHDVKLMLTVQNRVHVAETVLSWLGDAIRSGHSSLESLKEEERSEQS